VVTAQKRTDNLQSVPIAVSVISGNAVENLKATDLEQLSGLAPNVQLNYIGTVPNAASYTIRGIGNQEEWSFAGSAVSVVVDGVPQYFNDGDRVALYDIDRIEVLRGPQGTLFGANSTGGVINIVTKGPADDFGGTAMVTYGNFNRVDVGTAVSIPWSDTLKFKIVAFHSGDDGWTRNIINGLNTDPKNDDVLRGYMRYAPSAQFDATSIIEYDRGRNGESSFQNGASPGELFYVPLGVNGMYQSPCASITQQCRATGQYVTAAYYPISDDTNTYRATETVNWRGTPLGDLTSITGWRKYNDQEFNDQGGVPMNFASRNDLEEQWQISEEVRSSFAIGPHARAIVGGFVYDNYYNNLRLLDLPIVSSGFLNQTGSNQRDVAESLFAQTYVDLSDSLTLQVGARYSHEWKRMTAYNTYIQKQPGLPSPWDLTGSTVLSAISQPPVTESRPWNNVGGKVGLDYKIKDDVMVYGSWARGFKSGGYDGQISQRSDIGPYGPETVDTFEIGSKTEFLNHRLRADVALFDTEYRGQQISELYFLPQTNGSVVTGTTVLNAAKSRIYGAELEATAIISSNFSIDTSLAYLHATYLDFPWVDPLTLDHLNLKGEQLQNSPRWSGTIKPTYKTSFASGELKVDLEYLYTDSKYLQCVQDSPRCHIQPTSFVNGNLDWVPKGSNVTLSLWATNLLNKQFIGYVDDVIGTAPYVIVDPPRQFGVSVKYKF
jgi:iron complex outermembrane receptor protein